LIIYSKISWARMLVCSCALLFILHYSLFIISATPFGVVDGRGASFIRR
jgi:hypothetical protein